MALADDSDAMVGSQGGGGVAARSYSWRDCREGGEAVHGGSCVTKSGPILTASAGGETGKAVRVHIQPRVSLGTHLGLTIRVPVDRNLSLRSE